jgi:hypothetical protein
MRGGQWRGGGLGAFIVQSADDEESTSGQEGNTPTRRVREQESGAGGVAHHGPRVGAGQAQGNTAHQTGGATEPGRRTGWSGSVLYSCSGWLRPDDLMAAAPVPWARGPRPRLHRPPR